MSVAMVPTIVNKCATTQMEHTTASAMMVMNLMVMASHVKVDIFLNNLHQSRVS